MKPPFDPKEESIDNEINHPINHEPEAPRRPRERTAYRGATSDPAFGLLVAIAFTLGLTALPAGNADLRYSLSWGLLAGIGVLSWLLGNCERIGQEEPENLAWGVAFGLLIGVPLLAFGAGMFGDMARLIFPDMSAGIIMAYLVFVMPLGETLFFRNILQQHFAWWVVGLLSSLWAVILFFPVMWSEVIASPAVALVIATVLAIVNVIYSYVRRRNGLAAAWICQIIINLVILFLPSL